MISGPQWRDTGSGSGREQQVPEPEPLTAVQRRFRDLLDHGAFCQTCRSMQECEEAQRLYRAWRIAGGPWKY
ncbi:hypothetical protein SUDANB140_01030 [Streptomyces sp. enrichment culture]